MPEQPKRHAREYWLRLQADRAVRMVLCENESADLANVLPERALVDRETMTTLWEHALHQSAAHLVLAELAHRKLCELGVGKVKTEAEGVSE